MVEERGIQKRRSAYQGLAPMYARLAETLARDFVRLKGMSQEEADAAAIQIALDQARDTLVGMDEMDDVMEAKFPGWKQR